VKRTFVVPEEKELIYDKFKSFVPEVSGKLVELIEDFVNRHESMQAGMTMQTTYDGKNDTRNDIFAGRTFKFSGVLIAVGKQKDSFKEVTSNVYLTLKRKLLVSYSELNKLNTEKLYYRVFETYDDLANNGKLPKDTLTKCAEYLSKNSELRHFEVLDV
jgi:hypothetical protein